MIQREFTAAQLISHQGKSGQVAAQAPSNIALVKYWGKHGLQLPKNSSVSFTLSNCHTKTRLSYTPKDSSGFDFKVIFESVRNQAFEPKITAFFERIAPYCPYLSSFSFKIETENSFPHSSGIASSASGMSAIAACLMQLESLLSENDLSREYVIKKASFLARLGSGSACRSLEGPLVVWGEHPEIEGSSDLFGTLLPQEVDPIFKDFCDTVMLVHKGQKQVSSTVGHGLMHGHPYARARFNQANENIVKLIDAMQKGDLDEFIAIVESEALSLHAMMMSSRPYFMLMKPNTLSIIEAIWDYRAQTKTPVCFTLDAGANVHVLYPSKYAESVNEFIEQKLAGYCEAGQFIKDQVGQGAITLEV